MQKLLFLLLTGFISLQLHAQHKITGTVRDASTHSPLPGVSVTYNKIGVVTDGQGKYSITLPDTVITLQYNYIGYIQAKKVVNPSYRVVDVELQSDNKTLEEVVVMAYSTTDHFAAPSGRYAPTPAYKMKADYNTEDYSPINENNFHNVKDQALSTLSIDVDRASYSNIRRFLNDGQMPPVDAVRVEEMINYFDYQYKAPTGNDPVAIYTDMAQCPWAPDHQLVRVAVKGKEISADKLPPANLVFLLDVSGSMNEPNKLPLVKQALKALVDRLRPQDKVAIVVYAGAAGIVLPSTPGSHKKVIIDALENLQAGGSTAGGEGIQLAYNTAAENLLKEGNNRVILATDGDFNVGPSSDGELERLIEKEREKGIYLTVLGFGMGNYKDNKLELLADKGNGNYAYIDNFEEARRTFVTEFGGSLFTIAKDVKLQVEFNPAIVKSYRLIGYENRLLQDEDFNDDKKDAGDMGVGHTVTALYEIETTGKGKKGVNWVDPLKYQSNAIINDYPGEVLTVKLRYKQPASNSSQLMSQVLPWKEQHIEQAPEDFRMASAVAAFGLLLRHSDHKGKANYAQVLSLAKGAKGEDKEGYRSEFIQMVKKAQLLDGHPEYSGNIPEADQ